MSQASAKLEELLFKKFEEEKKGAPDSEEEKKEEVPVNALPIDPLEREAAMNALEQALKGQVEQRLKEVEEAEKQLAEIQKEEKMLQLIQNTAKKEV